MKAINWQIKLVTKIDLVLLRVKNRTYKLCAGTAYSIGLKKLIVNSITDLCISVQEKYEKDKKIYAED